MKLYFVRHGESEANLLQEFSNRGRKHGLTDTGRRQAAVLAQDLTTESITRIFSSPLLRAVQTAETIGAALGLAVEPTDALREYDCGILEGRSDEASWTIYDRVLRAWLHDSDWEQRIDGGESFLDMRARFVPFIDGLIREYHDSDQAILLVGHGGLYRCMLPLVLSNIDVAFALTHPICNTGAILAELSPAGLVCTSWCRQEVAR